MTKWKTAWSVMSFNKKCPLNCQHMNTLALKSHKQDFQIWANMQSSTHGSNGNALQNWWNYHENGSLSSYWFRSPSSAFPHCGNDLINKFQLLGQDFNSYRNIAESLAGHVGTVAKSGVENWLLSISRRLQQLEISQASLRLILHGNKL